MTRKRMLRSFFVVVVGLLLPATVNGQISDQYVDAEAYTLVETAQLQNTELAYLQAIEQVDVLIAAEPAYPPNYYARGLLTSGLGRYEEALEAYQTAVTLDPSFADAHYNGGVVLTYLLREAEAIDWFVAATVADPTMIDAYYNAGQVYYNLGQYDSALAQWSPARTLAPDDFDVVKKVMQAQIASGLYDEAWVTRGDLFRIWRTSPYPEINTMVDYVFDQFDVDGQWIYAFETFEPSGDLYYVYVFEVTINGQIVRTVALESSAVIREMGSPYVIGIQEETGHYNTGIFFSELPAYGDLRPVIMDVIRQAQLDRPLTAP